MIKITSVSSRIARYATTPDLTAFRDAGGKLILWHGLADPKTGEREAATELLAHLCGTGTLPPGMIVLTGVFALRIPVGQGAAPLHGHATIEHALKQIPARVWLAWPNAPRS
ncbi:MAG: hypothetical protein ACM3ML_29980 [Micromonosporaceae bacterium]